MVPVLDQMSQHYFGRWNNDCSTESSPQGIYHLQKKKSAFVSFRINFLLYIVDITRCHSPLTRQKRICDPLIGKFTYSQFCLWVFILGYELWNTLTCCQSSGVGIDVNEICWSDHLQCLNSFMFTSFLIPLIPCWVSHPRANQGVLQGAIISPLMFIDTA